MTVPLFAFLSETQEALAEFAHNCLLVAGGFLIGYILGGFIAWLIGKRFSENPSVTFKQLGQRIGGIVVALIVALIVFTGRGKPHGEGGEGKGAPTPGNEGVPKSDAKPNQKSAPTKLPETKPADSIIWVTILEGSAVPGPGKFYRIEDESSAKTLEELKAALTDRKGKEKGKVALGIRFNNNTPPGDPRLVTDLTNWATSRAGLDVMLPANK